jgi:hypothetical protein
MTVRPTDPAERTNALASPSTDDGASSAPHPAPANWRGCGYPRRWRQERSARTGWMRAARGLQAQNL